MSGALPKSWRPAARIAGARFLAIIASSRFWRLRFGIAATLFLSLTLLLAANAEFLGSAGAEEIAEFAWRLAVGLCVTAYVTAIFVAPAVLVGTLREAKRSGMVELLIASPLTQREIFASLAGAQFLTCASAVVTCVPIFALPVYLGGASLGWLFLRAFVFTALGVLLSGLYGLRLAISGTPAARTWFEIFAFIVFTPFAFVNTFLLIFIFILLAVLSGLAGDPALGLAASTLAFPFWSLLILILGLSEAGLWPLLGCVSTVAAILYFWLESEQRFSAWLERVEHWKPRETRSYLRPGAWKSALGPWRRRVETPAGGKVLAALPADDRDTGWAHSIARNRLSGVRGLAAEGYLLTRRNPFVARTLMDEGGVTFAMGAFLSVVVIFFTAYVTEGHVAEGGDRPGSPAMIPTVTALFLAAWLAASETARLIPARSEVGELEALLVSPVRGREVALGGSVLLVLRLIPLLLAVGLINALPLKPFGVAAATARILFFFAAVLFAYGLSLWASLLLAGVAERLLAGFLTFVGLSVTTAFAWPPNAGLAHPLSLVGRVSSGAAAQLAAWAGILGVAGLALTVSFALTFRRLAERG